MSIAKSKMVECEICGAIMRSRGIHSHKRQKHFVVIKTVTKVIQDDYSPTIVLEYVDLSQMTKVIEPVITEKTGEVIPGNRNKKIPTIRRCYRCDSPIVLEMIFHENHSFGNAPNEKFICDYCITTFYDQPGCLIRHGKLNKNGDSLSLLYFNCRNNS